MKGLFKAIKHAIKAAVDFDRAMRKIVRETSEMPYEDEDPYPEGLPPDSEIASIAVGDRQRWICRVRGRRSQAVHLTHDDARREAWERHWLYEAEDKAGQPSEAEEVEARVLYMQAITDAEVERRRRERERGRKS